MPYCLGFGENLKTSKYILVGLKYIQSLNKTRLPLHY